VLWSSRVGVKVGTIALLRWWWAKASVKQRELTELAFWVISVVERPSDPESISSLLNFL
jgi:hypothetical protein